MNLRELWRIMRAMLLVYLLVLLTIPCFVHSSLTDLPISSGINLQSIGLSNRIINGTKAVLRQFPHQVSLMRSWNKKHFCGGNLISASLVLTAGHCVYGSENVIPPWTIIVVGGILKLNETLKRQEKGVENIRIHPKFNLENLYNDVAVLKLSTPFTFTPEVRSIPLSGSPPVPNTICQVAGWGYTIVEVPKVSSDLMYVNLPIRSKKECRKLLKDITDLPHGMMCAGYLEGGRDACQGDSGGGMVCNGTLTGIVSGGQGCAEPLLPGVYADVFHYLDWILNEADVVTVVRTRNNNKKCGALRMIMILSFLFCTVFNYI
ncbi:PREDICTED: trypsin-2-like [Trachymyrmex cornetzi]|uniref:trypsin-2-like n=1 Tax=Trachymyrmex cornetzi TaxID=471704 RepID=UPI00084F2823|nr:PREDICTED: trypsin-2-like [Trachymyrmex cornetzi]